MKSTPEQVNNKQTQLTEQQLQELENDAVWSLLEKSAKNSPIEASPMFSRNVMREIRLSGSEEPITFWKRLTSSTFNKIALSVTAVAACVVVTLTQFSSDNDVGSIVNHNNEITNDEPALDEIIAFLDLENDRFTNEMLEISNQDPFFISEEEIESFVNM